MTDNAINESQRKAARIVGFAYLLAMATGAFGFYARVRVIVAGSAAETANNIMASEQLFRLGIASDVITLVTDIALITALYVIFKPINRNIALLAAFWRLMETAVFLSVTLNGLNILKVLSGAEYLAAFPEDQLQALARLSLSAYANGYTIGFVFLGLGSALFSYLWLKSNYIPRALAVLGIFSSLLMALCNFAFIIFPGMAKMIGPIYMAPIAVFEVAIGLWLLFKGLRASNVTKSEGAV